MLLYSIRNWSTQFENNRTRELKKLDWIPMPNKQDGDGYTAIMDLPDGPAIYGTFLAIAQVASRCEPRGTLVRDGGKPHDSASLSRMTRIPVAIIEKALSALSDPDINWLECSGLEEIPHNPAPSCGISTAPGCASRARIPEGKGREGKEGKGSEPPPKRENLKNHPSLEVCIERFEKISDYTPGEVKNAFLAFEAATDHEGFWMWGKRRVTDYRSAMESRMAETRARKPNGNGNGNFTPPPPPPAVADTFKIPNIRKEFTLTDGPTMADFGNNEEHREKCETFTRLWASWCGKKRGK